MKIKKAIKEFIKKVIPDRILYYLLIPLIQFIKYKRVYLFHTFRSGREGKGTTGVIFLSGEPIISGHVYRVERYIDAYRKLGIDAEWYTQEQIFSSFRLLDHAALLIIWRSPINNILGSILVKAKSMGITIVYDLDDHIFSPELAEPEFIDAIRFNGLDKSKIKKYYLDVRRAMLHADLYTCSTDFLASEMTLGNKPVFTLPNGYDAETLQLSGSLIKTPRPDKEFRIGYASGTSTHQKDFAVAVPGLVKILREFQDVKLVVFNQSLDINEFSELLNFRDRIEKRKMVPFKELQNEIAQFDVNIVPLEVNNFTEAKSELKYFEAALLGIPSVISPTHPFRQIIINGVNGFLAEDSEQWYQCIKELIINPETRKKMGKTAHNHVLWHFGPEERIQLVHEFLSSLNLSPELKIFPSRSWEVAMKYKLESTHNKTDIIGNYPKLAEYDIILEYNSRRSSKAGVIIPMYNYENYILNALDSVKKQTLKDLDLVIVDDCSTDSSGQLVANWLSENHHRFNNCALLRNKVNSKLPATRNIAYDFINTRWVMQLDADNELLPHCIETLLNAVDGSGASMVYPQLELFGEDRKYIYENYDSFHLSTEEWEPEKLALNNYIDAMALVSKAAWVKAGGYDQELVFGNEDYDFWLRFVENGFWGMHVRKVLARYRVHKKSMLRTETVKNKDLIIQVLKEKHPWITPTEM